MLTIQCQAILVYLDKQYVVFLKEIGKRTGEISSDFDIMFLLSLLPAVKQLSPMYSVDFRVEA
jgi:hypothetical protein